MSGAVTINTATGEITEPGTALAVADKSSASVVTYMPFPGSTAPQPAQIVMYVAYDADGEVLYIGQTNDLRRRLREHRRFAAWWLEVDHVLYLPIETRRTALFIESSMIREVAPVWNVRGRVA